MYEILKRWSSATVHRIVLDSRLRERFCERLKQHSIDPIHSRHSVRQLASKERDSAVLIPLVYIDRSPSIIFTHRSLLLPGHRGEVSFPGGRMEQGETYEQVICLLNAVLSSFLIHTDRVSLIIIYHSLEMLIFMK